MFGDREPLISVARRVEIERRVEYGSRSSFEPQRKERVQFASLKGLKGNSEDVICYDRKENPIFTSSKILISRQFVTEYPDRSPSNCHVDRSS